MILYIFAIQQRHAPAETYLPAFDAATKCQAQITAVATPGSLAQRYGVVLQELRLEVLRHNGHLLGLASSTAAAGDSAEREDLAELLRVREGRQLEAMAVDGVEQLGFGAGSGDDQLGLGVEFTRDSPTSSIMQMAGWDQFDSMVSLGFL